MSLITNQGPNQLEQAIDCLLRITKLHPYAQDIETAEKIDKIWKAFSDGKKDLETCKTSLKSLNPEIYAIYEEALHLSCSSVAHFQQELIYAQRPTLPVVKAALGIEGPVLLVTYKREDAEEESPFQSMVIKESSIKEFVCTELLGKIAEVTSQAFHVPECCFLDNSTNPPRSILLNPEEHQTENWITKVYEKVYTLAQLVGVDKDKLSKTTQTLLISQKVRGANLFEFATHAWGSISEEEKRTIFRNCGALSYIHLWTGNTDHLVQVVGTKKLPIDYPFEARLENVMVSTSPLCIYSIDNGTKSNDIDEDEAKEAYTTFLHNFMNTQDAEKLLADELVNSMLEALKLSSVSFENIRSEKEKKDTKEKLEPFLNDLNNFGNSLLLEGINNGKSQLEKALKEGKINHILNHLSEKYATHYLDLKSMIDEVQNRMSIALTQKEVK